METKICRVCKIDKPMNQYRMYRNFLNYPAYRRHTCNKCLYERMRKYRLANHEKTKLVATKLRKRTNNIAIKKSKAKYPGKDKARKLLHKAVKSGELKRLPCQYCDEITTDAHHPDYRRPLYVVWVCRKHHFILHERYGTKFL